jgi:hypothetical protein
MYFYAQECNGKCRIGSEVQLFYSRFSKTIERLRDVIVPKIGIWYIGLTVPREQLFIVAWYILWEFGIFYDNLVQLRQFGIFHGNLV